MTVSEGASYNTPVAKTAETASFRLKGSCSRHTQKMGNIKIDRSETTLKLAVTMKERLMLMQWPAMKGFQIRSRGVHSNSSIKKTAV